MNPSFYKYFTAASIVVISIIAGYLLSSSTTESKDEEVYQDYFKNDYRIYSLNIPKELSFADETVPLQLQDVRERFDRELHVNTYWQSNTLFYFKRSNKWFPVIEPILKEEGVPDDFKYLALVESGLMNVVSPAGARGFWQFREGAGREHGLEINKEVDERYHVEKATRAACSYLKEMKDHFGSWTMAAASYNVGKRGLEKQVERQKADYYYNLLLNEETSRYIFRILAAKEILNHPGRYGFRYRKDHLYEPYNFKIVEMDTAVKEWADFAHDHGVNYKVLKILNPWLRQSYLKNRTGNTYEIKLPADEDRALYMLPQELIPDSAVLKDDTLKNDGKINDAG